MVREGTRVVVAAVLTALALAACSSGPADRETPAAPASPTRTPTPLPTRDLSSLSERCSLDLPGRIGAVRSADGRTTLSAVVAGRGDVAVVLLHQAQPSGLCGWVTYARWLARQGVLAIAVDDCTHGTSRCSPDVADDTEAMVALAVDAARARGARTVGVVGASMGGSRALGVGQAAGADAVVDLSGPTSWPGVPDAVDAARATSVPLLVAYAAGDPGLDGPDGAELRAAVDASPAERTRLLRLPGRSHGWDLTMDGIDTDARVTDVGRLVLAWIRSAD